MKVGVVIFPGSNCDFDAYRALKMIDGVDVVYLWHGTDDLQRCQAVILPGGFSYGDYLRSGSFARFRPLCKKWLILPAMGVWFWGSATVSRFYLNPVFSREP